MPFGLFNAKVSLFANNYMSGWLVGLTECE